MSSRRFIPAVPVIRTPGGSVRIQPNRDPVLVETSPTSRRLKTWRPPNTPTIATPERAASPAPGPSKSRRRLLDDEIEDFLNNSGSESDLVSSDDEGEEEIEDAMDPGVTMRQAARRLRELQLEKDDADWVPERQDEMEMGEREERGERNERGDRNERRERNERGERNEGGDRDEGGERDDEMGGDGVGGDPNDPEQYTFSWSDNFETFSGQEEMYLRDPGPTIGATDPLAIFLAIWDVTILAKIVHHTNLYAWQTISALSETGRIPKYLDRWVETTINEMQRFFAMLMIMALDYRARVDEYWHSGILFTPVFRNLMSRNRFQLLMKFLHFADNYEMPANLTSYEKKMYKVKEIFESVQLRFSALYVPTRELSLDETLLLWKGRLNWVQCIRTKAARFGIKSFELCESSTGYLLKSILYAGKNSTFVDGPLHGFQNKTSKVVLELMGGFLDVGHIVVMDNWYNALALTRYLKLRRTDVLGTLNKNRVFVPADIKAANPKTMTRGQQIARHCGDIAVTTWKDVKLVTVLSTYHKAEQVLGRRAGQNIMKPTAIETYNKTMGGVDLKDTKLSHYPMERKRGRKWYIKVFMRLLNTSIMNAHVIHTKNPTNVLDHRSFRFALVESLVQLSRQEEVPRPLLLDPAQALMMIRLDCQPDHHPIHTQAVEGKREKFQRRRCKLCTIRGRRSEVNIMCSKCRVPLCVGQCWIKYHTERQL